MAPELQVRVSLEASVSPSEDPGKVAQALENLLFGEGALSEGGLMVKLVSDRADSLGKIREQFRDRHVRGAARRLLVSGIDGGSTTLMLNRQAAAAGVVALCSSPDQSPLGPIRLTIESKKLSLVIDWLTAYDSG